MSPTLTSSELANYRELLRRCDEGGNDGADVYEIQEFCKAMEEKYGIPFGLLSNEMKTPTIKELMSLAPGTLIPMCSGKIASISPFQSGTHEGIQWSLQNLMLEDPTGEIPVKIGNHDEVPADWLNKNLLILAHKKAKGGLSGVKMDEETYDEGGVSKSFRQIAIAKSGELVLQDGAEVEPGDENVEKEPDPEPSKAEPVKPEPKPAQVTEVKTVEPETKPADGMRVSELRYERTINTGNYCSEKIGLTIELAPGTKAIDALRQAQLFIEKHAMKEVIPPGARPLTTK